MNQARPPSTTRIGRVQLHLLKVPLREPYRLAFGDLHAFDTLLVELTAADGRRGFGEATILNGYTDESIDGAWQHAKAFAQQIAGADAGTLEMALAQSVASAPFTSTAFGTALEMLVAAPVLQTARRVEVPLLALLQGDDRHQLADRFEAILADGYRTVKIKVGLDKTGDLGRVARIQDVVAGRARIRIDANQAFDVAEAVDFVRGLDPQGIELFEQPCAAGDWDAQRQVAEASRVPLMLDESIYDIADIERTAREGLAAFVKVKLMKFGSLARLEAALQRIRALGMQAVLGNGVACAPNCWMEACVAARHIDNAGEMNGFLKPRETLLVEPLVVERGALTLRPGWMPVLDRAALARCRLAAHEESVPLF
jgi:o-succinylbenzoate synthase